MLQNEMFCGDLQKFHEMELFWAICNNLAKQGHMGSFLKMWENDMIWRGI